VAWLNDGVLDDMFEQNPFISGLVDEDEEVAE